MLCFKIIIIFLLALYFNVCFAQAYTLTGKIKRVEDGWAFIWHRQNHQIDSGRITKGKFFSNCFLICGASGGMMGAAYFRELFLKKKLGKIIAVITS